VFKPGEVYWLRAAGMAGWGPLAPAEIWTAGAVPRLYLHAHTTYASFAPEAQEINPASRERPKETLPNAIFTAALPSPAMPASRLDAQRPVLRAGSTRIVPVLAGVTFDPAPAVPQAASAAEPPPPPAPAVPPRPPEPAVQETVVVPVPVETPVYYPAPVYTGIVVVNPPENRPKTPRKGPAERPSRREEAAPPRPVEPAPAPVTPPRVESRAEPRPERRAPQAAPAPPDTPAEQPSRRDLPSPRGPRGR
jgi:hypothetical protein